MPRGRAGLDMIPPARVREAFRTRHGYGWTNQQIADRWYVAERTVRRWKARGLPLCYGAVWITRQQWEEFERSGKVPRTPPIATENEKRTGVRRAGAADTFAQLDRQLSASSSTRARTRPLASSRTGLRSSAGSARRAR